MGRFYVYLWIVLGALMGAEFYLLHKNPDRSMLMYLQTHNIIRHQFDTSPAPGRPLSLVFGYAGFGIMAMTNLYIMRKRFSFLHSLGNLKNWLDFHIFCGLMGPTLILFHCDFKVRGLVAISFWSMVVSFSSGVVGRYFYVQISRVKGEYARDADTFLNRIGAYLKQINHTLPENEMNFYKRKALIAAGAAENPGNPFSALFGSFFGDIKIMLFSVPSPAVMGSVGQQLFMGYAINTRKANTVEAFNRLMGYWHTFHTPFAVFMYIAAILHIIAEFWLGAA